MLAGRTLRISRGIAVTMSRRAFFPRTEVPVARLATAVKKKAKKGRTSAKKRNAQTYLPDIALRLVKSLATARFDETVEIALQLGVDPRKPGQNVRGVGMLPHGTGKTQIVAVFARDDQAQIARRAGADIVGAEDLVEQISSGNINFTKTIATPEVMPLVGRVARILGPRGLMPNPKLGTVTTDVELAVKNAKRGQVQFRVDKAGTIHAPLGKVSFTLKQLLDNLRAFMLAVNDVRPEGLRGQYMRYAVLSSTMGPGIDLDMWATDPSRPGFMFLSSTPGAPPQPHIALEGLPIEAQRAAEAERARQQQAMAVERT